MLKISVTPYHPPINLNVSCHHYSEKLIFVSIQSVKSLILVTSLNLKTEISNTSLISDSKEERGVSQHGTNARPGIRREHPPQGHGS